MIIIPISLIISIAFVNRYVTKTWLSPGSFFSICWSFFILLPIIFAPDYYINQLAIWFIAIFSIALVTGSIVSYYSFPNDIKYNIKEQSSLFDVTLLDKFFIFFSIISFLGIYFLFSFATNTYTTGFYDNSWLNIPNQIAVDRYSGVLNYPIVIKYSLYFIFPANLLGGILVGIKKISNSSKIYLIIPLLEAVVLGVIEGARTSILLGIILFFSGWLSTQIFKLNNNEKKRSIFRIIFNGGIILSLFTSFFVLIQWLRQGMDTIILDLLVEKVRAYFFGYLAAFSQWISSIENLNISLGFITFAGPYNYFGIIDRPLGFYEPIFISNKISTNIFTAFRGLVTDFTIFGAIVLAFIIGLLSQFFFQKKTKYILLKTLPISMFYAFTLYSPLISIFHYNSILFSWVILLVTLKISKNETLVNYS